MFDEDKSSGGTIAFFALFLIILFGLFSGRGLGNFGNAHAAEVAGTSLVDRDLWQQHCDLTKQIGGVNQNVDLQTAAIQRQADGRTIELMNMINRNRYDDLHDRWMSSMGENIALKSQIYNDNKFAAIQGEFCSVQRRLDGVVKTPPFIINGNFPAVADRCCDPCCS